MFRKNSLKFLEDLLNSPSPSGYEIAAAKVFREYLADCCHVTTDVMGNTIASLNEKAEICHARNNRIEILPYKIFHVLDRF